MSQLYVSGVRYPDTKPGMDIDDFRRWTCLQLKEYLGDRTINRDGLKDKLVANAYGTYKLELPVENTDAQTEKEEVNEE